MDGNKVLVLALVFSFRPEEKKKKTKTEKGRKELNPKAFLRIRYSVLKKRERARKREITPPLVYTALFLSVCWLSP